MSTKSFNLTLSRWHHVADRIAGLSTQLHGEAVKALGHTSLATTINDQQATALRARGEKALKWVQEAQDALVIVGAIRVALAKANATHGITTKLAEAESLRRQIKAIEELTSIDLVTRTPLDNVNDAIASAQPVRDGFGRSNAVLVALVDASSLDHLADQAIALKARVAALTDEVASLNRASLSLELPTELAQAVGVVSE